MGLTDSKGVPLQSWQLSDAAIIGAGPAGASCALWLRLLGYDPILIEKEDAPGGLLRKNPHATPWNVALDPTPAIEIARRMESNIALQGVRFAGGVEISSIIKAEGGFYIEAAKSEQELRWFAKTLVIATGTMPRAGGLSGVNLAVGNGNSFQELNLEGRSLAIVGGGDNAGDAYGFAKARGAKRVKIYSRSELRMQKGILERVGQEDVVLGPWQAVQNSAGGWSVGGVDHDCLAAMLGYEARVPPMGFSLASRAGGGVEVDAQARGGVLGVFAAGEVSGRMHPCIPTAIADGVVAAKSVESWLKCQDVWR